MCKKKLITALVLVGMLTATHCVLAASVPGPDPSASAGVQLQQLQEAIERDRVAQQIAEDQKRAKSKVEGQQAQTAEAGMPELTFELTEIKMTESAVLKPEEIKKITGPYLHRKVSVKDLYAVVSKINEKYEQDGYRTCRAFLRPQTIKGGVVEISLVEGRTGQVELKGNKTTRDKYITSRIKLDAGKIKNTEELNNELLWFNGTNDVQLRIVMKAGTAVGTTDYVLEAYEPKQQSWSVYTDNAGNYSTGDWRYGLFYNNRSLTKERDSLTLSSIFSRGSKAVGVNYSRPIDTKGTRLLVGYSTNAIKGVEGDMETMGALGHAYAANIGIIRPLVVTDRTRSSLQLNLGYNYSTTDLEIAPAVRATWVDERIKEATLAYEITRYGDSSAFYNRFGINIGRANTLRDGACDFQRFTYNGYYQKRYQHGQQLSIRLEAQLSGQRSMSTSARYFYLGGMNSVRGYQENLLAGDSGVFYSLEYGVPLDKKRQVMAYVFTDGGRVFGEHAFDINDLASVGFGVKANITKNLFLNVCLGIPLRTTMPTRKEHSARVHFMLSGTF